MVVLSSIGGASEDTGVLAYRVSIVLECYDCGTLEEFELGKDVPVHQLDTAALEEAKDRSEDVEGERHLSGIRGVGELPATAA